MKKQAQDNLGIADKWWAHRIRKDGSIASTIEVENGAAQQDGEFLIYTCARTKSEAIKLAKAKKNAWSALRLKQRFVRGVCAHCPSLAVVGRRRCRACTLRANERKREKRRIAALPEPERSLQLKLFKAADRRVAGAEAAKHAAALSDRRWDYPGYQPVDSKTKSALRQCLRAYDRDPKNFRQWLWSKIGEVSDIATAAE